MAEEIINPSPSKLIKQVESSACFFVPICKTISYSKILIITYKINFSFTNYSKSARYKNLLIIAYKLFGQKLLTKFSFDSIFAIAIVKRK